MNLATFKKAENLLTDISHYEANVKLLAEELNKGVQLVGHTRSYEFMIPIVDSDKLIKEELQRMNAQLKEWRNEFKQL